MKKTIEIYITKVCNFNCEYCYVELESKVQDFQHEEFSERINLLEYDMIRFIGGEPLIKWKDIAKIVETTREKKPEMEFIIITNGSLLDTEKVEFINHHRILVENSLHFRSFGKFFGKKYLETIFPIRDLLRFSIIFQPHLIDSPVELIFLLEKYGFYQFALAPEIYADWTSESIIQIEKALENLVQLTEKNRKLIFFGPDMDTLEMKSSDCHKTVVDEQGSTFLCNRIDRIPEWFQYHHAFDYFDQVNGCFSCKHKWFCICPVSWYLDYQADKTVLEQRAKIFHQLNEVFIEFFISIQKVRGNKNFLTGPYDEIRLNMTNQCNLRCNYCYLDFNNQELSYETAINIVEWHLRWDGEKKAISFFGGEPLLKFENIRRIVEFSDTLVEKLWKKMQYRIATNAILMNPEIAEYLASHDFDIHISWNGNRVTHNETRDRSYDKLQNGLTVLTQFFPKERIVILLGFWPKQASSLFVSFQDIFELWYRKFNFELFYGEKYVWDDDIWNIVDSQMEIIMEHYGNEMYCLNSDSHKVIDISAEGKIDTNSFSFHTKDTIDFSPKKRLLAILNKYQKTKK